MEDTRPLTDLVAGAIAGDSTAWTTIVRRHAALVVSVARGFRLGDADVADISQTVWLRLLEHLPRLRNPEGLRSWLVTTTRNESLRVARAAARTVATPLDPEHEDSPPDARPGALQWPDSIVETEVEQTITRAEREAAVRDAFAELPPKCRRLLSMLISDPPVSYDDISKTLDIRIGSIGPTRGRCLDRMRRCPALVALMSDEGDTRAGAPPRRTAPRRPS